MAKSVRRGATNQTGPKSPDLHRIAFEAALNPTGNAFAISADGEARLTLVVPEAAAEPLARAMADGWLRDTSFVVTITLGKT